MNPTPHVMFLGVGLSNGLAQRAPTPLTKRDGSDDGGAGPLGGGV